MRILPRPAVADHHVRPALDDGADQCRNVAAGILIVTVGVDDDVGAETQAGIEPGAEGARQAPVVPVADDVIDADVARHLHCAVGGAVVDRGTREGMSVLMFVKRGYWSLDEVWSEFRDFLFLPALLAGVAWAYMLKFRSSAWPSIALAGFFTASYLFFGTVSLHRLANLPFQERYTFVYFPMIAIGVGFLFYKSKNKIIRIFVICTIFIHALSSIHGATHRSGDLYFESLLRNAVIAIDLAQQKERKDIYVDRRYREGLRHYLPSETFRSLRDIPEKIPLPPGYYMVFYNHLAESYKRPTPMRTRYEEIARLPVALRVALPHTFASRYFPHTDVPKYAAIVHEKRR